MTEKKQKKAETRGRKSLPSGKRRDNRNVIKTNDQEQRQLVRNAKKAGYDSVVVWLRELGLRQ